MLKTAIRDVDLNFETETGFTKHSETRDLKICG